MIYTHVLNRGGLGVRSPWDRVQHLGTDWRFPQGGDNVEEPH